MIKADAQLRIQRIPLSNLVVTETDSCWPEKFNIYLQLLQDHPDQDVDPLIVTPLKQLPGMWGPIFAIRNGKHKFAASIMAGRSDVLAVVVEE